MQTIDPETIIASPIEPGESVRTAFNAYVNAGLGRRVIGANGSTVTFNPRNSFIGQTGSAEANIKTLFALISGRV